MRPPSAEPDVAGLVEWLRQTADDADRCIHGDGLLMAPGPKTGAKIRTAADMLETLSASLARVEGERDKLIEPARLWWQAYQDRCENAYIEQTIVDQERKQLQALAATLQERVAKLEEGLAPFGQAATRINGDIANAVNIWPGSFTGEWFTGQKPLFNASDLRRAQTLLSLEKCDE